MAGGEQPTPRLRRQRRRRSGSWADNAPVERREGSRSHRDTVVAPRKRDKAKECACRRSTRPSSGVGPAAVATVTGSSPPQRQSSGRRCGDKRRDKRDRERQGPGTQTCAAGTRGAARWKPQSGLFDIVKTERERARRASRNPSRHAPADPLACHGEPQHVGAKSRSN